MKKFLGIMGLAGVLLLSACCHGAHGAEKNILAATFPVYLFTANVCANVPGVRAQLLAPAQTGCPHDFAPRAADLAKLAHADVLVVNGAGLEDFLVKPLAQLDHKLAIIDAGLNVPVLEAPQAGQPVPANINAHIFAAPANAARMVRNIGAGLAAIDSAHAGLYQANAEACAARLDELSARLESIGRNAKNKNVAIEHDALAYLAGNAGLHIVACLDNLVSAGQLAGMGRTLKEAAPALLAGDAQFSDRLLKTLAEETGVPFVLLDPCAGGPENAPLDYYEQVMSENAATLERALE